jgi:NAD-dependent deacetylase
MSIADVHTAAGWVGAARRIVALTGAGLSTESGIPDFRGPNGVWTKNPAAEKASTLQHFLADTEVRRRSWQSRLNNPLFRAEPNVGHAALVHLEHTGRLMAVVTQNVDGLHQAAGHDPAKVIEVHGTVHYTRCWDCDDRRPMEETLTRVSAGEDDPACTVCGGILKSDAILFGQNLVPEVIDAAARVTEACDLLIAAGTSLKVFPAANMVPLAKRCGARVVIVNGEPTGMDHLADLVLRGRLGELLPTLCGLPDTTGDES